MSVEEAFEDAKLESANDWARRKIKAAGYHVTKLWKILPPDGSGETEVLFRGRPSGKTGEPQVLTAYIPDDPNGDVLVAAGW